MMVGVFRRVGSHVTRIDPFRGLAPRPIRAESIGVGRE